LSLQSIYCRLITAGLCCQCIEYTLCLIVLAVERIDLLVVLVGMDDRCATDKQQQRNSREQCSDMPDLSR